jgi:hypothetical protein
MNGGSEKMEEKYTHIYTHTLGRTKRTWNNNIKTELDIQV